MYPVLVFLSKTDLFFRSREFSIIFWNTKKQPVLCVILRKNIERRDLMSRNFYISDLHFGHANVIEFDKRPFSDVEEMDRMMIWYWNQRVTDEDDVYILGDFQWRSGKGPVWYLKQLKGRKHLIIGNHDAKMLKDEKAMTYFESCERIMYVKDNGRDVILCHFPMAEWSGYHRNQIHLYGHIHGRLSDTCLIMRNRRNAYNAGACINFYMPCTLDEIIVNNKKFEKERPLSWKDLPPSELKYE